LALIAAAAAELGAPRAVWIVVLVAGVGLGTWALAQTEWIRCYVNTHILLRPAESSSIKREPPSVDGGSPLMEVREEGQRLLAGLRDPTLAAFRDGRRYGWWEVTDWESKVRVTLRDDGRALAHFEQSQPTPAPIDALHSMRPTRRMEWRMKLLDEIIRGLDEE
jgi:hypothetical protein